MNGAWTHWATSKDLVALRLPAHDAGTGLAGRPLGTALRGARFCFDPFDAYAQGLVSNPNVVVAGSIGAGKSTIVKMLVDRGLERGGRAVVIDPKGEYGSLARSHGATVVALGRDGWCSPFGDDERENRTLLRALLASAQGAALTGDELYEVDGAWDLLSSPHEPRVIRDLCELLAPALHSRRASARRSLALTLHRFVHGDLAGLFDGDDAPLRFDGDLVVLDLSAQWSSQSFQVAALLAVAAAQQVVGTAGIAGYLVLDEAWALLSDDQALTWLRGSWKLARARGLAHVLVLHRWSDVDGVADATSAQRERAIGLLRECETTFLFRQPSDEARDMGRALSLHAREERFLVALPKGVALVRYGPERSILRVEPDERDRRFIDTDAAMRVARA